MKKLPLMNFQIMMNKELMWVIGKELMNIQSIWKEPKIKNFKRKLKRRIINRKRKCINLTKNNYRKLRSRKHLMLILKVCKIYIIKKTKRNNNYIKKQNY